MLTVAELVAGLPLEECATLANALGAGLHDARMAAQCLTDPEDHASRNVVQLAAYLTQAIESLETARSIVRQHT
jgi:hypothetical protein